MSKKLSILLAAIAAFAFAVPSMAGAAELTLPAGTRAPVGTAVTMTGKPFTLTTSIVGATGCATLNVGFTINKNDGTTVEGSGQTSNPTQTSCANGSNPITVTDFSITKLLANGTATSGTKPGTMSFTTKWDLGGTVCNWVGTNVPFTYTYKTDTIKFSGASGVTSTGGCGTAKLDAEFTLEKSGSTTAVIFD